MSTSSIISVIPRDGDLPSGVFPVVGTPYVW